MSQVAPLAYFLLWKPKICLTNHFYYIFMYLFTFKCKQCLRLRHKALHCPLNIQPFPQCFDSQHKKMTTLHTKHTTPNTIWHTNYTLQTRYMSQISQLSKLAISVTVTVTAAVTLLPPSLPKILIPVCCSCVSGSPQTRTDTVQTHLVSLIHNSQFRCTEQDRTAGKIPVQLVPLQV